MARRGRPTTLEQLYHEGALQEQSEDNNYRLRKHVFRASIGRNEYATTWFYDPTQEDYEIMKEAYLDAWTQQITARRTASKKVTTDGSEEDATSEDETAIT